jgi:hypothetical protein
MINAREMPMHTSFCLPTWLIDAGASLMGSHAGAWEQEKKTLLTYWR